MNHPREPFERLFDSFNECFAHTAKEKGLMFDKEPGKVRRSLRILHDPLKRGIFLELREHVLEAHPTNPQVMLAYGAWFFPKPHSFPLYYLRKVFYEGGLIGLRECLDEKLKVAASEIKCVSQEQVIREGKLFTDWPHEGESDTII